MLLYVRLQNSIGTLRFRSRVLRQDQMLQFPVRTPELQVETHSHCAEDSHTAQRDYGESATLEGSVDVGLEVEIVLVVLIHPEPKIRDDKRLY